MRQADNVLPDPLGVITLSIVEFPGRSLRHGIPSFVALNQMRVSSGSYGTEPVGKNDTSGTESLAEWDWSRSVPDGLGR
jgi:hypothetical protein